MFRITNVLDAAVEAGFECAVSPGKDAKGKDKPPKTPATSAVEQYLRTLPEYMQHQAEMSSGEEAWATIHAATEAARQRTWALKAAQTYEDGEAQGDNSRLVKSVLETVAEDHIPKSVTNRRGPPPPPKLKRSKKWHPICLPSRRS